MTGELGQILLMIALVAALVQAWGGLTPVPQPRLVKVAALWQMAGVVGAIVLLALAFAGNDFSILYVARNSHSTQPLGYRIAAVWGGHEGSMLLWLAALTLWGLAALRGLGRQDAHYMARTLGVLGIIGACVGAFVLFTSNPFDRLLPAAGEGGSLNPLLQDPGMALHPPLLYLGYVGTAVPFAMTLAALWGGAPANWTRWARPYTAVALAFLSLGIALGSWWAYYELGWGGWWFWDPVENASLMPWLALAALLHILVARDQHGRFAHWTAILAIGAFVLSLLGTFLVRSGVLTSVHAFASDPRRGSVMLALIALALLGSLALMARHGERLRPPRESRAPGLLSRDTALALNNLLLVAACGCVLLGTLYPLLMDALQLGKLSVGAPYFDAVMAPLLLPALALLVPAVWLRWGQDKGGEFLRRLWPTLGALVIGAVALPLLLSHAYGQARPLIVVALLGALGVATSTLHWAWQRLRGGGLGAAGLGMVAAHLGVAAFVVGVAMVKGYGVERDVRMAPGSSHQLGDCTLVFKDMTQRNGPNYAAQVGNFVLTCADGVARPLVTEKRSYVNFGMPMTETAILWGLTRDIYVALGAPADEAATAGSNAANGAPGNPSAQATGAWSVRVQLKPFIRWIWIGVLLMGLGAFATAASRRLRRATAQAGDSSTSPASALAAGMPAPAPLGASMEPAR